MLKTLICLVALALAGCASTATREQAAALDANVRAQAPICRTDKDCERMWAAARQWVMEHADFKIQTYSADYIETFNIRDFASTGLWARVTKTPGEGSSYRIAVTIGCNNPMMYSHKALVDKVLDFDRTVAAAARDVLAKS
jgi:hypothetical protein